MTDNATTRTPKPVRSSGTFTLGYGTVGATTVHRLGFGAMQITGDGVWGEPSDREECVQVLRRAVDMIAGIHHDDAPRRVARRPSGGPVPRPFFP